MDRTIYFKIYLTTERSWFRATGCVKINFKIRPKKSVSTWEVSHSDAENWWFMSYVGNSVISEGIATCYYLPYMQDSLQAPEINLMEYVSFKQIPSWKVVLLSSQIKQASHSFFILVFQVLFSWTVCLKCILQFSRICSYYILLANFHPRLTKSLTSITQQKNMISLVEERLKFSCQEDDIGQKQQDARHELNLVWYAFWSEK